jgi:hypothetical protein
VGWGGGGGGQAEAGEYRLEVALHYAGRAGLQDFGEEVDLEEDSDGRAPGRPAGIDGIIGWHIAGSPFALTVEPPAGPLAGLHPYADPPAPPCAGGGDSRGVAAARGDSGRWVRRDVLNALARGTGPLAAAAAAAGEAGVAEGDDEWVWVPWGCRRRRFRDAGDVRACVAAAGGGAADGDRDEDVIPRILIVGSSQQVRGNGV